MTVERIETLSLDTEFAAALLIPKPAFMCASCNFNCAIYMYNLLRFNSEENHHMPLCMYSEDAKYINLFSLNYNNIAHTEFNTAIDFNPRVYTDLKRMYIMLNGSIVPFMKQYDTLVKCAFVSTQDAVCFRDFKLYENGQYYVIYACDLDSFTREFPLKSALVTIYQATLPVEASKFVSAVDYTNMIHIRDITFQENCPHFITASSNYGYEHSKKQYCFFINNKYELGYHDYRGRDIDLDNLRCGFARYLDVAIKNNRDLEIKTECSKFTFDFEERKPKLPKEAAIITIEVDDKKETFNAEVTAIDDKVSYTAYTIKDFCSSDIGKEGAIFKYQHPAKITITLD